MNRIDPFTFSWDELPASTETFREPGKAEISLTLRPMEQPDVYAAVDAVGELEGQYITGEHPDCKNGPFPVSVQGRFLTVSTPLIQQCVFLERMTTEESETRWGWKEWAAASVTLPKLFKSASGFAQRLQRSAGSDPNASAGAVPDDPAAASSSGTASAS